MIFHHSIHATQNKYEMASHNIFSESKAQEKNAGSGEEKEEEGWSIWRGVI